MTEHPLYLGLDLSPEYTQLSYYKLDEGVPESICHSDSKDTYLLPNIMFYTDKYKDGTGRRSSTRTRRSMEQVIKQKTFWSKCCCFISGNLQNSLKAMRSGGW